MKHLFLFLISFYQIFLSNIFKNLLLINSSCRFEVSCSDFAKKSILKYGVVKGLYMSFLRILKCQPFIGASYGRAF